MATISLQTDGLIDMNTRPETFDGVLSLTMESRLECGAVYHRDHIYLHGNVAQIRRFAQQLMDALPSEEPKAIPDVSQPEPEAVNA